MDDLTMDLVRLCRRNRDGSLGTQNNRQRGLAAMADELRDLGYKLPNATSLKPKHAEALVEKWLDDDKTDATIRNRLTWLRWWAEKINKPNVIQRDNNAYGVGDRTGTPRTGLTPSIRRNSSCSTTLISNHPSCSRPISDSAARRR